MTKHHLTYLEEAGLPQYQTVFKMADGREIIFLEGGVVVKKGNAYEFPNLVAINATKSLDTEVQK